MRLRIAFAALALTLATLTTPALAAYKLIPANTLRDVDEAGLIVTPPAAWNKIPYSSGKRTESWTLDGITLNELEFFAAIPDGKSLTRDDQKRDRPLPRFAATMLAPDIIALYETTLRAVTQTAFYSTESVEPATFAGAQGFRWRFNYVLQDDVKRKGEGVGAVIGGKLYMAVFTAPELHYFGRDVAQFRAIVRTAKVVARVGV